MKSLSNMKHGEKRTIERFLYLPKKINGRWIWLETVTVEQWADHPSWYEERGSRFISKYYTKKDKLELL